MPRQEQHLRDIQPAAADLPTSGTALPALPGRTVWGQGDRSTGAAQLINVTAHFQRLHPIEAKSPPPGRIYRVPGCPDWLTAH